MEATDHLTPVQRDTLPGRWSRTVEDPASPPLVAAGLLGVAAMLGPLGVGEMSHEGP